MAGKQFIIFYEDIIFLAEERDFGDLRYGKPMYDRVCRIVVCVHVNTFVRAANIPNHPSK